MKNPIKSFLLAVSLSLFMGALLGSGLHYAAKAQEEAPPPANKNWLVMCALPGQPVKQWEVVMPHPISYVSGFWRIEVEGKDVLVPVCCTIIEER